MRHTGRYRLGDELPVLLRCGLGRSDDRPGSHPYFEIRTIAGVRTAHGRIAADEQQQFRGFFRQPVRLESPHRPGRHVVIYRWRDSTGTVRQQVELFDIVPGGHVGGNIISMHPIDRPHANYLLFHSDSGQLSRGVNPRV